MPTYLPSDSEPEFMNWIPGAPKSHAEQAHNERADIVAQAIAENRSFEEVAREYNPVYTEYGYEL
jgi:hypothetical protein